MANAKSQSGNSRGKLYLQKPQKLTLTSVGGKKVKPPKGTKTVSQNANGNLVYMDKNGKPIRKSRG